MTGSKILHGIPENEKLRHRLDDFYTCAKDALSRLYTKEGYQEMCTALCSEVDDLNGFLSKLDEQYQEELPLESEEPRDVQWMNEIEMLRMYAEKFVQHESAGESQAPKALNNRMMSSCELLESIDTKLFPESDPDIYSSYSKRELSEYVKFKWMRAMREMRTSIVGATAAHRNESMQSKMEESRQQLRRLSNYLLSEDNSTLYHEGIGRYIWQNRHSDEDAGNIDNLLYHVKCLEYYSGKLGCQLTFLDRENSPAEEADESVRLENLRQETLQNQKAKVTYRLSRCEQYLNTAFTGQWIDKMLESLINSEHTAQVCEKMKSRKLVKFIHQVAGVLLKSEVFVNCSYGELADALAFLKPQKDSRKDYIRHMIDDYPVIQAWIEDYVNSYRQGLRKDA